MKIIVLDTETIGVRTQDLLNLGYIIADINPSTGAFKVLKKRDYLVGSLYANTDYMINDMLVGAEKYGQYTALLERHEIVRKTQAEMLKMLIKDIERYKIVHLYAYNCAFDKRIIENACAKNALITPCDNILDIWSYAKRYICNTPSYIEWAKGKSEFTESGKYISTTVESVTRYLCHNDIFVEDHTALSDTHWELAILSECAKLGCDITEPLAKDGNIKSNQIFRKTMVVNGETIEFSYTNSITRNGITYYR